MDNSTLQHLTDRMQISDTIIRYATGIDMRDWDVYRSCFCEEIEIDFKSWNKIDPRKFKKDEWVDLVRKTICGFTSTQHISSNHVITIEDDQATCVSYMQAQHYLPNDQYEDTCTLGGYYTNELIRTSHGWKIKKCKLTVTWTTGDPLLFKLANDKYNETMM